jgi:error-prone DNA polymerase
VSPDPFVHLHVASGYSLQYGASHPHVLVERAAEQEMDTLALTDRDGTYGAVKFVRAARSAGVRPVLGVDLAVAPTSATGRGTPRPAPRRTPVRGGAVRDLSLQQGGSGRVTFLASGKPGWAALCRMVSSVHLAGERGRPVATLDVLAPHLAAGDLLVLLGPASDLGAAATRRRDDLGLAAIAPWR